MKIIIKEKDKDFPLIIKLPTMLIKFKIFYKWIFKDEDNKNTKIFVENLYKTIKEFKSTIKGDFLFLEFMDSNKESVKIYL